jgi:plastocyanin
MMGVTMKAFLTAFTLSLVQLRVRAQETATGTATAAAATFTVEVGKGGHTFKPDVVQANIGDIVEFNFFPPNHSVVRAE